jgi:hypothetical protein
MAVETQYDQTPTVSGWTELLNSQNSGTDSTRLTLFWKIAVGSDARTTNDPGDHIIGRIIAITTGTFDADDPFAAATTYNGTTKQTPGLTIDEPDCLIFGAITHGVDFASASTAVFSSWTNASLTSITERMDNGRIDGNGGALGAFTGARAAVGTINATTVTTSTGTNFASATVAIRQPANSTSIAGSTGTGRYFNGVSNRITFTGGSPVLSNTADISMAAIFKPSLQSIGYTSYPVISIGATSSYDYQFGPNSTGVFCYSGAATVTIAATLTARNWYFMAVTKVNGISTPVCWLYDITNRSWLLSGTNFSSTLAHPGSTQDWYYISPNNRFAGTVAMVGTWKRKLTQNEIEAMPFDMSQWYTQDVSSIINLLGSPSTAYWRDEIDHARYSSEPYATTVANSSLPGITLGAPIYQSKTPAAGDVSIAHVVGTLALSANTNSVVEQAVPTIGTLALSANTNSPTAQPNPTVGTLVLSASSQQLSATIPQSVGSLTLSSGTNEARSAATPTVGDLSLGAGSHSLTATLQQGVGSLSLNAGSNAAALGIPETVGSISLGASEHTVVNGGTGITQDGPGTLVLSAGTNNVTAVVTPSNGLIALVASGNAAAAVAAPTVGSIGLAASTHSLASRLIHSIGTLGLTSSTHTGRTSAEPTVGNISLGAESPALRTVLAASSVPPLSLNSGASGAVINTAPAIGTLGLSSNTIDLSVVVNPTVGTLVLSASQHFPVIDGGGGPTISAVQDSWQMLLSETPGNNP